MHCARFQLQIREVYGQCKRTRIPMSSMAHQCGSARGLVSVPLHPLPSYGPCTNHCSFNCANVLVCFCFPPSSEPFYLARRSTLSPLTAESAPTMTFSLNLHPVLLLHRCAQLLESLLFSDLAPTTSGKGFVDSATHFSAVILLFISKRRHDNQDVNNYGPILSVCREQLATRHCWVMW